MLPAMLLVPDVGVLVRDNLQDGAEEMVRCLARVVERIPSGAAVRYLTADQEAELLDWDAEKYRQQLADGPSTTDTKA